MVRVFYSNGHYITYDTALTHRQHVQAIVQKNHKGWYTESYGDFYLLREGFWQAADFSGVLTELKNRQLIKIKVGTQHTVYYAGDWIEVDEIGFHAYLESLNWICIGETIMNSERFTKIHQMALSHADFARRNGELPEPNKL